MSCCWIAYPQLLLLQLRVPLLPPASIPPPSSEESCPVHHVRKPSTPPGRLATISAPIEIVHTLGSAPLSNDKNITLDLCGMSLGAMHQCQSNRRRGSVADYIRGSSSPSRFADLAYQNSCHDGPNIMTLVPIDKQGGELGAIAHRQCPVNRTCEPLDDVYEC